MTIDTTTANAWPTRPADLIEHDTALHGTLARGDIDDPDITIVIGLECPQCQAEGIQDDIDLVYHPKASGPCAAGTFLAHTYIPHYLCEQGHVFIDRNDLQADAAS